MMQLFKDVWMWIQSAWDNWVGKLTGGTLTAILLIYSIWTDKPLQRNIGLTFVALCFLMACFNSWRKAQEQKREIATGAASDKARLEKEITLLKDRLETRQEELALLALPKGVKEGLGGWLQNINARIDQIKQMSPIAFFNSLEGVNDQTSIDLVNQIATWIEVNIGHAEKGLFEDRSNVKRTDVPGSMNDFMYERMVQKQHWLDLLAHWAANLRQVLQQY